MMLYVPLIFNTQHDNRWINFNEDILQQAVAENKIVLVNITADWCTTCKINEIKVLNNEFIQNQLSNVILMKGDFTNYSQEIKSYIDRYQSPGIPLTVIYGPNHHTGIVMPTILTEKHLIEIIRKITS